MVPLFPLMSPPSLLLVLIICPTTVVFMAESMLDLVLLPMELDMDTLAPSLESFL
jgi:hypothetical protein